LSVYEYLFEQRLFKLSTVNACPGEQVAGLLIEFVFVPVNNFLYADIDYHFRTSQTGTERAVKHRILQGDAVRSRLRYCIFFGMRTDAVAQIRS